eukprot:758563-Hanusia_phi.AAC.4
MTTRDSEARVFFPSFVSNAFETNDGKNLSPMQFYISECTIVLSQDGIIFRSAVSHIFLLANNLCPCPVEFRSRFLIRRSSSPRLPSFVIIFGLPSQTPDGSDAIH